MVLPLAELPALPPAEIARQRGRAIEALAGTADGVSPAAAGPRQPEGEEEEGEGMVDGYTCEYCDAFVGSFAAVEGHEAAGATGGAAACAPPCRFSVENYYLREGPHSQGAP